jgi:hypothetical protein
MSGGWNPPCVGLDRGGGLRLPYHAQLWIGTIVFLLELGLPSMLVGARCGGFWWCAAVFGVLALVV